MAVPPQYGTPEPGPEREHQPNSLHFDFSGQSASVSQVSVQMLAPMHIVSSPNLSVHSSSAKQLAVHCLWAM